MFIGHSHNSESHFSAQTSHLQDIDKEIAKERQEAFQKEVSYQTVRKPRVCLHNPVSGAASLTRSNLGFASTSTAFVIDVARKSTPSRGTITA